MNYFISLNFSVDIPKLGGNDPITKDDYPCVKCGYETSRTLCMQCSDCGNWVHKECTGLTNVNYMKKSSNFFEDFYCILCKNGVDT